MIDNGKSMDEKIKIPLVKALLISFSVLIVLIILAFDRYLSDQQVRQFSVESARIVKDRICPGGYSRANPCGTKDVRQEADYGFIAFIHIYGVTDTNEIGEIVETIRMLRSGKQFYRRVPVKINFYVDLKASSTARQFWILGE